MDQQPKSDPFAPVEFIVSILLCLLVALTVTIVAIAVVQEVAHGSTSVSLATIGDEDACATVAPGTVPYGTSGDGTDRPSEGVVGLREGAEQNVRQVEICLRHPTVVQKAAATVGPVGELAFALGSLWLIRLLIRTGREQGLFTTAVAARTRTLGWFLLGMSLAFPFLAGAGRGVVLSAAVDDVSWIRGLSSPGIHWSIVVVALGVLTFARILDRAIPLQEEVDATV